MKTNHRLYINNIYSLLILGCIALSLVDSFLGSTSTVRLLSVGFALICITIFIFRTSEFYFNKLLLIIFLWVLYNLFWLFPTYNNYYLSVIFQQVVLLLFIWSGSIGDSPVRDIQKHKNIIILYQIFAMYFMIFTTRTGFVSLLFAFSFFSISMLQGMWRKVLLCFFYMSIFWYSEERSRVLAFFIIAICILVLPKLSKVVYKVTYWIMILTVVLIPKIYLWVYNMSGSNQWNVWIRENSGKNLFSGREEIWGYLDRILSEKLLFGFGGELVGGALSVNSVYGISTHNLMLFLRGQGGFFLVFLFALFLYYIWVSFYDYLSNPYVLVGASYLVGLLFRASFDLVLMANNFVDSLFLWLPLIIAFSSSQNLDRRKKRGYVTKTAHEL